MSKDREGDIDYLTLIELAQHLIKCFQDAMCGEGSFEIPYSDLPSEFDNIIDHPHLIDDLNKELAPLIIQARDHQHLYLDGSRFPHVGCKDGSHLSKPTKTTPVWEMPSMEAIEEILAMIPEPTKKKGTPMSNDFEDELAHARASYKDGVNNGSIKEIPDSWYKLLQEAKQALLKSVATTGSYLLEYTDVTIANKGVNLPTDKDKQDFLKFIRTGFGHTLDSGVLVIYNGVNLVIYPSTTSPDKACKV